MRTSGSRDQLASGAVRDSSDGKPRYDLIPPEPLRRVAHVYREGGELYGDHNWTQGQPTSRLLASAMRHVEAVRRGETDEDHAAQAVWNLLGLMHFQGTEWDDLHDWSVDTSP